MFALHATCLVANFKWGELSIISTLMSSHAIVFNYELLSQICSWSAWLIQLLGSLENSVPKWFVFSIRMKCLECLQTGHSRGPFSLVCFINAVSGTFLQSSTLWTSKNVKKNSRYEYSVKWLHTSSYRPPYSRGTGGHRFECGTMSSVRGMIF